MQDLRKLRVQHQGRGLQATKHQENGKLRAEHRERVANDFRKSRAPRQERVASYLKES